MAWTLTTKTHCEFCGRALDAGTSCEGCGDGYPVGYEVDPDPKADRKKLISQATLSQRQSLPLAAKVAMTNKRIREWYEHYDGQVYVSVSGGLDSTVLAALVWAIYPGVPGVFVNTGLEYPEIVAHVKTYGKRVEWLKPAMPFAKVIDRYGYPVVSKRIAQYIHEVQHSKGETATKRLRLTGIKTDGGYSALGMISKKWQYLCTGPFKVSHKCCNVMKKRPFTVYNKRTGRFPYVGTRAGEGQQRTQTYFMYGCNAFNIGSPRSAPLSFWLDADIREYIAVEGLAYSALYDPPCSAARSGCMFCMFGVHLEGSPNRFEKMKKTHPKQWKFCMDKLGLRAVLEYIKVPCESVQMELFE